MTRNSFTLVLAAILAATLTLAGCGRKGPLERPPGAAKAEGLSPESDATVRGPRRPFVLDRLLR